VGPRADLDAMVKRKIPSTCSDSKPRWILLKELSSIDTLRMFENTVLRRMFGVTGD
jgi:hypothetical protein